MTYDAVNPGPDLGQAQKDGGVKSVNGTPPPPILDLNSDDNKINNNLSPLNVNAHKNNQGMKQTQEKFEDIKSIIISRKSKVRQYNGQKKKDKQCLNSQNRNDILFTQFTFKNIFHI